MTNPGRKIGAIITAAAFLSVIAALLAFNAFRRKPALSPDAPCPRVVSMSCGATEIICALGLRRNLVGRTTFCDWPADVADVTPVADAFAADYELIKMLEPDTVFICSKASANRHRSALGGIGVVYLPLDSEEDIYESIGIVAEKAGVKETGTRLVGELKSKIARLREKTAGLETPRVLFLLSRPFDAAGGGTYIDRLIEYAGGRNVLADRPGWTATNAEEIVVLNPEVIIDAREFSNENDRRRDRQRFEKTAAIAEGQIYIPSGYAIVRPGPRITDALEELIGYIHPEIGDGE